MNKPARPVMTLRQFCIQACDDLYECPANQWAALFVERRMALQQLFLKGRVLSTTHGTEVFKTILDGLAGGDWDEKGEYGNNFRALITEHRNIQIDS